MSVSGTTQADLSAKAWADEATAAAEAYAEEQAAKAARERDEAEANARGGGDGVDPSGGGPGSDGVFPTKDGPGTGPPPGVSDEIALQLDQQKVDEYRALGLTVTSVGNGWYIVNAPNNPAHDVRITEKAPPPLEAPDALPPLPGELPPPKIENPPAGAAPDPNVDGGAPVESKTPPDPDKVVTGLGEEVDKIVNQSPTLQKHIRELQARGWKIEFGSAGVGGIGKDDDVIFIDPSLKKRPDQMAAVLAHEVGHARHPVADVPREGLSREEYMRRRVDAYLDSEGAAALETVRYQEEVRANGGNLDIAGFHDNAYRGIYDQLQSGQVTEQEAMHRMGQVYGDGELHGDSRVTYRDHFIQAAEKDWNDA